MGRRKAAIFINSRQYSLQGIAEYSVALAPSLIFFSSAQLEKDIKAKVAGSFSKAHGAHKI